LKHHIERTRSALGGLGGLVAKTEAAERKILESAQARLDQVNTAVERLRSGIEAASPDEQDRYTSYIEERGQLNLVIAKAKVSLGTR
jgi:uncharacterized protein YlxW (UPF0749 family)